MFIRREERKGGAKAKKNRTIFAILRGFQVRLQRTSVPKSLSEYPPIDDRYSSHRRVFRIDPKPFRLSEDPFRKEVDFGTDLQTLYAGLSGVWIHSRVGPLPYQVYLPVGQKGAAP